MLVIPEADTWGLVPVLTSTKLPVPIVSLSSPERMQPDPKSEADWSAIEQPIGTFEPKKSSVALPKSPSVSRTFGNIDAGNLNSSFAQMPHSIVKGSKRPVADADDTSVTWLPGHANFAIIQLSEVHNWPWLSGPVSECPKFLIKFYFLNNDF